MESQGSAGARGDLTAFVIVASVIAAVGGILFGSRRPVLASDRGARGRTSSSSGTPWARRSIRCSS